MVVQSAGADNVGNALVKRRRGIKHHTKQLECTAEQYSASGHVDDTRDVETRQTLSRSFQRSPRRSVFVWDSTTERSP